MKCGLLTSILGEMSFEEVVSYAEEAGFGGLEVACWPSGKAERRYAGVSHIDVESLSDEKCSEIKKLCSEHRITISALCYYPNILDVDEKKATACKKHLVKVIQAAGKLGVGIVGTFIGREQNRSVTYNLEKVKRVWPEIIKEAKENNVKIAIENCPMLFTEDEWPGGQNLATSPEILRKIFEIIPSAHLGLNFDPSHFVWQQMDYIKAVYEFREKIFHVHLKDIKVDYEKLGEVGVMAPPLQYMTPRIPGGGDVDWKKFIGALRDNGYEGYVALEIEDKEYEENLERIKLSIRKAMDYLRPLLEA